MNELLSHTESHITQEAGQTPITNYLRGLNMISDEDRLPRYIPDTVLIQHYVEFRVVLRRCSFDYNNFLSFTIIFFREFFIEITIVYFIHTSSTVSQHSAVL